MNQITIADKPIAVKTWHGQRVVTFKDIDTVHSRPDGTASRNFRTNRKHFIEGEDWHKIKPDEIRRVGITSPNGGIVLTETGYLMLVKSFTDDLAWQVQRELVKHYFRGENIPDEGKQLTLPEKPYEYYDKTWKGEPVLSSEDFAQLAGVSRSTVSWHFRRNDFTNGVDFYLLKGKDAAAFRAENPRAPRNASNFYLITASGFRKLCKYVGAEVEEPKIFIEMKKEQKPTGNPLIFIPKKYHEHLEEIRFELEAIKQMTYLLDIPKGCMIDKETRLMYQDAICRRVKGMQNLCCNFAFSICMIAKER